MAIVGSIGDNAPAPLDKKKHVGGISFVIPSSWADTDSSKIPSEDGGVIILTGAIRASETDNSYEDELKNGSSSEISKVTKLENIDVQPKTINKTKAYKGTALYSEGIDEYRGTIFLVPYGINVDYCFIGVSDSSKSGERKTAESIADSIALDYKRITLSFSNDGKVIDKIKTLSSIDGAAVNVSGIKPVKYGWELDGWTVSDGDEYATFNPSTSIVSNVTADVTFEAKWARIWTVNFTDGNGKIVSTQQVKNGGAATEPNPPTPQGYKRTGWDAPFNNVQGNLTINPVFTKVWTVTFVDGRGNTLSTQTIPDGTGATAPSQPFASDATFLNWDKDFSKVTGDMTVTAVWKKNPTLSQRNALNKAQSYLAYSAFSRQGLIEQLEFEQYSTEDATYAADNCGANWNQQAAEKAKQYLDYSSFSRNGLISQLEFEGFTHDQAVYGVNAVGL